MSSDDLHDLKTSFDAPTMGISEKLETAAKSIAPALGLEKASADSQRWARNFAALMEYYKLVPIARNKNISFGSDKFIQTVEKL